VSARRGWVERLSGGRTAPTAEPSASRPEPGPDRPVRSNGPERPPRPGPGPRARPPVPDPEGPTLRLVLVSRDNMLAGALRSLIETPGGVRVLDWYSEELDSAIRHADVVIVDMPPNLHERTFAVLDGRFLGRTVVLLQEGEQAEALPAGPSRAVLFRPLQIGELWTTITGATRPVPAEPPPQEAEAGSPAPEPEMGEPEAGADVVEPEAGAEEAADDHAAPGEAEGAATAAAAVAVAGQGLPVTESGRLIGPSGRELEPVIGPGQVAPGMDEATLERLRRWGRQAPGRTGQPAGKRRTTAGRAETRQAKVAQAEARAAAREQSRQARAEARSAARAEARQARAAGMVARRVGAGGVGLLALVVAVVGLVAAGWRGGGGPESRAGEVAVVRAAGGSEGGLVVQDPRVGPIEPLYALGVGVVLRGAEAGTSLEGAIRDARVPSRYLLAGVVGLTMLLFLLLMRVGPGTGAAAGPGPAPPRRHGRDRLWRLGGAALAGLLVALDPVLVRSGRAATGTVLALALALVTLALAWGVPARPTLRWLPLVAAGGGLALLVSPLALPVLAVPVVAELLDGHYQEAWRDMAALGLAFGLWLVLPVWVAGQALGAGQAGWLLGRPPGRGSVVASLADDRLTWLLVAAGLAAAILTWRHRSGARPDADLDPDPGPARALAWTMTTAAGAVGAVALGYPASQALPFAVPAAAVSLALAGGWAVAAIRGTGGPPGWCPGGSGPGSRLPWPGCSWPRGSTGGRGTAARPTTASGGWWPPSGTRCRTARRSTPAGPTTGPGCWPPASP
jgi:hypothetical protein